MLMSSLYRAWLIEPVTEIHETRIDSNATGGSQSYGIYALGAGWQGSGTLSLRNVFINALAGSFQSAGIWLEANTAVILDIYNSKVWSRNATNTYGISQGGNMPIGLRYSSLFGATKTLHSVHNVSVGYTDLVGGPITVTGWLGCMAISDEMGIFYPNSCPQ